MLQEFHFQRHSRIQQNSRSYCNRNGMEKTEGTRWDVLTPLSPNSNNRLLVACRFIRCSECVEKISATDLVPGALVSTETSTKSVPILFLLPAHFFPSFLSLSFVRRKYALLQSQFAPRNCKNLTHFWALFFASANHGKLGLVNNNNRIGGWRNRQSEYRKWSESESSSEKEDLKTEREKQCFQSHRRIWVLKLHFWWGKT